MSSTMPLDLLKRNRGSLDIDTAIWNKTTSSACTDALAGVKRDALDPSGLAMCYNLASLDNSTGFFRAELRLYQVAFPIEDWNRIGPQILGINLRYDDASISDSSLSESEDTQLLEASAHLLQLPKRGLPRMKLLQTLGFIGRLHESILQRPMNL
jgi:hypothetical protein